MKKITVYELALMAVFAALLIAVQLGLSFIPNVELVSFLIIIYTLILGWRASYVIAVFVAAEGLLFGFGTWWFCYIYVWSILEAVTYLFRKKREPLLWALVAGVFGLLFGVLCSPVYLITLGFEGMLSWIASGLLFDVIHGVANFALTLVLFKPVSAVAERFIIKNGRLRSDWR